MTRELNRIPDFNDIVFERRNKRYGAYILRKKYSFNVIISLLIGINIMAAAILIPYANAKALVNHRNNTERLVEIRLENLDPPNEIVAPPPPPPPPPTDAFQQAKYLPPVVVDSVKPEEMSQLMTADDAQNKIKNEEAAIPVKEVREESQEAEADPEPFISVEEMPEPPGGLPGLLKYIAENTKYPQTEKDNNIQGKVFVRFCVTSKGNVDKISIIKGVDSLLDAEAIRVVKTFPPFKPGKQSGRPVPVWFTVPFNFKLY